MRFSGRLKLALALGALLALALLAVSCGGSKANVRKDETAPTTKTVEVTTAAAIKRELPQFFEATGSLAGDEQTDVAPQTSGKVVEVGVDIGSAVKRGQILVKLDDAELKLRVNQSLTQVEQSKAAVRQAEEKIGLRSGQTFDPNRVAEVAAAKVGFDLAEKNLKRAEKLIESGDVSRSFYDQQRAQREIAPEGPQLVGLRARTREHGGDDQDRRDADRADDPGNDASLRTGEAPRRACDRQEERRDRARERAEQRAQCS